MNWFYRLRQRFRFGIDNLMIYITVTMLAVYLADLLLNVKLIDYLNFDRELIFQGQIWRVITFIFIPPDTTIIFVLFSLYFYYFIGSTLEQAWGTSQFTFYYLCGAIGTIIAGMITGTSGNSYLNLSLFFAFAQLFPETQVLLFFIIPVKIKWLAYLDWALFAISFIGALIILDFATCASILVSILNFFLFFGPDFINRIKAWNRRRKFRKQAGSFDNFWRQRDAAPTNAMMAK
jgi:membrane associated rhomboid family serine protease